MAQNIDPIYTKTPKVAWAAAITAANTAMDGTGTVSTVFTADATNGSFIQKLRFRSAGTNVITVARIFINNGSSNATPANNTLFDEVSLPATTASATSATAPSELVMAIPLPAGYKVNVVLGTAVSAGWVVTANGGDY